MKFSSMKYGKTKNLGDEIQSFAAEQYLPRLDEHVERDLIDEVPGPDKHVVIMNGWFSPDPTHWPPSDAIEPVFFGFHIGKNRANDVKDYFLSDESIAYFKRFEPIGCRDKQTRDWLKGKGVDAFYSRCLTLTFPKRAAPPVDGKIFLVDVFSYFPLPDEIRKKGVILGHGFSDAFDNSVCRTVAKGLLDLYRDKASLVITSRLHCAMPCIAMGIPVVYLGEVGDYRTSILEDIGFPIHVYKRPKGKILAQLKRRFYEAMSLGYLKRDIWNPDPFPFEDEKAEMRENIRRLVNARLKQAQVYTQT